MKQNIYDLCFAVEDDLQCGLFVQLYHVHLVKILLISSHYFFKKINHNDLNITIDNVTDQYIDNMNQQGF